jgi:dTDP-4-amino-4,6-dideoxygalactose transaminase
MLLTRSKLAIEGGEAVCEQPVLIHKPSINQNDIEAVTRSLESTFVSGDGPACRVFEEHLREFLGVKHALFVNSCTAALDLAFMVKKFPKHSEVIIPDFTYTSTALGAILNNLCIRLADVNPDNGNLDVSKLESYITAKTVAICPVDYAGNPAKMDEILAIAQKYGLYVLHDTAQSIGAQYKGQFTGNQAEVSTFSFHGTKNMTTGEGGALVTNDDKIAEMAKIMREKGTDKHSFLSDNRSRGFYQYISKGHSFVQSNINGALGVSQLQRLEMMNALRKDIAEYYLENLRDIDGLDFLEITSGAATNWHIFGILVPPKKRYWILDALRAEGIMTNVHYTPLHRNKYYQHKGTDLDFPGAMHFYKRLLRLPIYPCLTMKEREQVVIAVKKVFAQI